MVLQRCLFSLGGHSNSTHPLLHCRASEEDYSDDEDTSWKVRRACAKLASAIIEHYPDLVKDLYRQLAPVLTARFREREEAVRCDILATYADLAKQAGQGARRGDAAATAALSADVPGVVKTLAKQLKGKSVKAKVAAFKVLHEAVGAAPEAVGSRISDLVPGITLASSGHNVYRLLP